MRADAGWGPGRYDERSRGQGEQSAHECNRVGLQAAILSILGQDVAAAALQPNDVARYRGVVLLHTAGLIPWLRETRRRHGW